LDGVEGELRALGGLKLQCSRRWLCKDAILGKSFLHLLEREARIAVVCGWVFGVVEGEGKLLLELTALTGLKLQCRHQSQAHVFLGARTAMPASVRFRET